MIHKDISALLLGSIWIMRDKNLLEACHAVHEVLSNENHGYACVGGLATDAILTGAIDIETSERRIYLSDETYISTTRPNGTAKDIDLLSFTSDIRAVNEALIALRNKLDANFPETSISLSGYDRPSITRRVQFTSQTVDENTDALYLKMGSLIQNIDRSDLECTWTMQYKSTHIHTLHPVALLMSYKTRSLGGIRPKDKDKVIGLENFVSRTFGTQTIEHFAKWEAFAEEVNNHYSFAELMRRPTVDTFIMTLAKTALKNLESNPWLTALAQGKSDAVTKIASRAIRHSKPSFQTQ